VKAQSRVVANESEQAVSRDNTDRAIFILREDYATTENMTKRVMPAFVFARRPDIEHQGGLLLAGILVVDLPKAAKENKRDMRLVEEIVQELTERARSGVLGDELTVGWHGGHKPENFNRNDDVSLATWARGCLKITVRVGPPTDDLAPPRLYH